MNINYTRYVLVLSLMVGCLAYGADPDFNGLIREFDKVLANEKQQLETLTQMRIAASKYQEASRLEQHTPDRTARRTPSLKLREVPVKEQKKETSSSWCNGMTRNVCIIGGCALAIKILSSGYLVGQCT